MKQALELFNSKSYSKAEKALLESGAAQTVEGRKYLFLIAKVLKKQNLKERFNDYLAALGENKNNTELLLCLKDHDLEIEAKNFVYILSAFWDEGRVEEFEKHARRFWKKVLEKKLYAWARSLREGIKASNPLLFFNEIYFLVCLMETGFYGEAAEVSAELRETAGKNKRRLKGSYKGYEDFCLCLRQTLEEGEEESKELAREIQILNRIINSKSGSLSSRALMEYLIFFADDFENLVLSLSSCDSGRRARLKEIFLSNHYDKERIKLGVQTRKLLAPEKAPAVSRSYADTKKTPEILSYACEPVEFAEPRTFGKNQRPVLSSQEKEILGRIKAADKELIEDDKRAALVRSFFDVGFYQSALELINLNPDDSTFYYLKCHALLELGRHLELADYSSDLLAQKIKDSEQRAPFLYMCALSNLKARQSKRALKALSELVEIDPNFRNTQELLKLAKT